ncbi:MAG: dicarboxylate/amino acid:cation symporter [Pseudomonadota bacterium]|nr:dicarboxylate/amino acid:cation symporter [Pseudomonadota bacterium]
MNSVIDTIKNQLWAKVMLGLVLGVVVGVFFGPDFALFERELALTISNWLALPGYLFLAIIKMVVIPLIFSSIVCGIAAGDSVDTVKKLGVSVVFYFIFTTTVAVSIGLLFANLLQPGSYLGSELLGLSNQATATSVNQALLDSTNIPKRLADIIPSNPLGSMASGEMLQVVIFAAALGVALVVMPQNKAKPLVGVNLSLQDACMVIVNWVLKLAPYAVFGLIAQVMVQMGLGALSGMLYYMNTVILGLLAVLLFYLSLVVFVGKRSVLGFLKQVRNAQLIAFSTSSSSATMPVTLKVAEENVKVNPTVSRFVIPLGTTINMDGTALYQAIATVFLAQAFGIDLTATDLLLVLVTAIAASVGTPGTPGVGIVILATILSTVGVPIEGIAIIIGVDRLLDMCRTTINVTGDITAAVVLEKLIKK